MNISEIRSGMPVLVNPVVTSFVEATEVEEGYGVQRCLLLTKHD